MCAYCTHTANAGPTAAGAAGRLHGLLCARFSSSPTAMDVEVRLADAERFWIERSPDPLEHVSMFRMPRIAESFEPRNVTFNL